MANWTSENETLLGEDGTSSPETLNTPAYYFTQTSMEFDISANSEEIIQLFQEKEFGTEPPSHAKFDEAEGIDRIVPDYIDSDNIDVIESDFAPKFSSKPSISIPEKGVRSRPNKAPTLVLTEDRELTRTSCFYAVLTCSRSLLQKDLHKKLAAIGIDKSIETGHTCAHSSEELYVLYEFKTQEELNTMCRKLADVVDKHIAKKKKVSDRIPMSLQPARPIYSRLKCCLELSLTQESAAPASYALQPIFITLAQSLVYLIGDGTADKDITPASAPDPTPNRLPAFSLCLQFNKIIYNKTERSFAKKKWEKLDVFPQNKSLVCYANSDYGEAMPYILCETGKEAGMMGSRSDIGFAIYLFVAGKEEAMEEMKRFYDTLLLSENAQSFDRKRVTYPLLSDPYSDRELILIHVPDKTTIQQKAVSLYINTTNILSLICKLQKPVSEYSPNCVCLYDPQGNRVVLRDLGHVTAFKGAVRKS